jgi:hypothetical protein
MVVIQPEKENIVLGGFAHLIGEEQAVVRGEIVKEADGEVFLK